MTAPTLRLALAQINPHVGNIGRNAALIRAARAEAARLGADLVVTPQFSLGGHPPEGLALDPAFLRACAAAIEDLAAGTADGGPGILLGGPWQDGAKRHDAVFLLEGGRVLARRARHEVGAGEVFDPGPSPGPVAFRGWRLGLMIGGDAASPAVAETLAETGAEILVALGAPPFLAPGGAARRRLDRIGVPRVVETGLAFVLLGQVGGQDGRVFDGGGFVLNPDRGLAVQMPLFEEALTLTEWRREADGRLACAPRRPLPPDLPEIEQLYRALVLGLRDFVEKGGFPGVVLDPSGGVAGALAAAIAVDALGPDRVRGAATGPEGAEDAAACAALLGIRAGGIDLGPALEAMAAALAPAVPGRPAQGGALAAGLQARLRAAALAALAEGSGALLLSTCDRTAIGTGAAAPAMLHGDLAGGFAPLKEVHRTGVLALARWRNATLPGGAKGPPGPVVPDRLLAAPGGAGGAALPAQPALDAILAGLEGGQDIEALVAAGHDRAMVLRLRPGLMRAEALRRRAPPGVMLTTEPSAPRYPLTNGFTGPIG